MDEKAMIVLATAIDKARNGVEYDTKDGAMCPLCGSRARVTHTMMWLDRSRKRYHKCVNASCLLCMIGETVCSWQELKKKENK